MNSARELIPLKTPGDEKLQGEIHAYRSIKLLRYDRMELLRTVSLIDLQVENMLRMKGIYQKFCAAMQNFSTAIFKLDRNNQGVPYVVNVKNLVMKMNEEFNTDEVRLEIAHMRQQQVPFLGDLLTQFDNFQKLCESILVTHVNYHVTYLEDFHLVSGKIRGMMKTISNLMYEDEDKKVKMVDGDEDQIIGDKDIQEASAKVFISISKTSSSIQTVPAPHGISFLFILRNHFDTRNLPSSIP